MEQRNYEVSQPKALTDEERKEKQSNDYAYWYERGAKAIKYHDIAMSESDFREAAFFLHQASEHFLAGAGLVLSGYRPKGHDLEKLETWAAQFDPGFPNILPRNTDDDERLLKLLQSAYVDARYKSKFNIEENELDELKKRVIALRGKLETLQP